MLTFDQKQPSVMSHDFSKVPNAEIQRSMFRRNHTHKTTFDAGLLIPIFCDEVLPGDTFNMNMSIVARLATPIVPIMDNMVMDVHFFFVPNRLVWDNWERFMGAQDNPDDSTDFIVPCLHFSTEEITAMSIYDYLGLPVGPVSDESLLRISALPLRGINLIWNQWFRDQNLQDSLDVPKDDGPDDDDLYTLLRRGKRHDYFTSALLWPQKGPGVELPLGTLAPVITGENRTFASAETNLRFWNASSGAIDANSRLLGTNGATGVVSQSVTGHTPSGVTFAPANLWADLSNALAPTINSFREAIQLQKLLERDARGGTRYPEILLAHFGVSSPDHRLQRPEYLGGGTVPVNIHSVPQTSVTAATPQGNMAAYGYASKSGVGFSKAFVEHGTIIGFISCRADLTYQTGINRMWSRQTKYDFYWPALCSLGEQEILNKEIFYSDVKAIDETVWGYQERWAEYRYAPSKITGLLRSSHPQSLDVWHLSQDFTTLPGLNETFIQEDPPIDRVIAVPAQPHFIVDTYFDLKCARPMPLYSVPGLVDHF